MDTPNQRIGSVSNTHVGSDFERIAMKFFAKEGIALSRDFSLEIGLSTKKKHCFDLGTYDPKIIVECKPHKCPTNVDGHAGVAYASP
jgi:hypothetical protein